MDCLFDHEKLTVYQRSIEFVAAADTILESIPKSASVQNQLERASTSIPLNIAEGNGKWTPKDRCKYFDSARGSALECAAALDISVAKGNLEAGDAFRRKKVLVEIVRMLIGLIKVNDTEREFGILREDEVEYQIGLVKNDLEESGGEQE